MIPLNFRKLTAELSENNCAKRSRIQDSLDLV